VNVNNKTGIFSKAPCGYAEAESPRSRSITDGGRVRLIHYRRTRGKKGKRGMGKGERKSGLSEMQLKPLFLLSEMRLKPLFLSPLPLSPFSPSFLCVSLWLISA
jgi:hypothetical protein